jgi:hypothetical protein
VYSVLSVQSTVSPVYTVHIALCLHYSVINQYYLNCCPTARPQALYVFRRFFSRVLAPRPYREHRNYDNNNNIALRDDDDYYIPHYRTDYISKFPIFNLPRTWNLFSSDLVSTPNRSKFTYGATVFLLDKLSETPSCNRLLCPSCLMNNIGQLP